MIRITVTNRQGAPLLGASADFGPQGGTIGRADTNTLVLSDPDRTVSRVHAQVLCRDGRYFIVDRGSNPLHCNGMPLGAGNEVPLLGGELLVVGSFQLKVSAHDDSAQTQIVPAAATATPPTSFSASSAAEDPFADLLQGLTPGAATPAAVPVRGSGASAELPDVFSARGASLSDPLAAPASSSVPPTALDPFADLLGPPSTAAAPTGGAADDFSNLGLPAAANATAHAQRIDELFGGMGGGAMGSDPLALSPLADPLLQPNTAARDDPLAAFGEPPPLAPQAARSDHLPVGQFGFKPPKAVQPAPAAVPKVAPEPAARVALSAEAHEVRFDDQTGQPIRISRPSVARPVAPVAAPHLSPASAGVAPPGAADPFDDLLQGLSPAPSEGLDDLLSALPAVDAVSAAEPAPALPPAVSAPVPPASVVATALPPSVAPVLAAAVAVPQPPPSAAVPASPASATGAPVSASGSGTADELLAAFLRGLGPVHQVPTSLTPALMERIGVLLRSSTEGTLQLLLTRQELKREVRAEVTMIAAQANNPLKFSPTADVALAHLLGPGIRGFMPAEAAMRDAYDDLRAHQFGVMVGMRAALAHVIERFGPETLEKKIAAKSALDSLFAAGRKAKLWDQFIALYGSIAAEAEDDFHSLFGKAFLQAYEEQMARLKSGAPQPPG